MKPRIYLASSWRNQQQPEVVKLLRGLGYSVYDFRNPEPGNYGFHWSEIDKEWESWTSQEFIDGLSHPIAESGFEADYDAMMWADAFVLLLPCGKSAHLELGWAAGQGKQTFIVMAEGSEPELMYKLADHVCRDTDDLCQMLVRQFGTFYVNHDVRN